MQPWAVVSLLPPASFFYRLQTTNRYKGALDVLASMARKEGVRAERLLYKCFSVVESFMQAGGVHLSCPLYG